ncbi:MAG: hypothetical protein ACRBFS_19455 [Aureispira sp.]
MPQDILATALPFYITRSQTGWGNNSSTNNERTIRPITASAILGNIKTRIAPAIGTAMENCQAVKIHWSQPNNRVHTPWQNAIQSENCIIADGDTMSTQTQEWNPNLSWKDEFEVDFNICGNAADAAMLLKENMDSKLAGCMRGLNDIVLSLLESNKAIIPASVTTEITDVTIANGNYVISDSSYWGADPTTSKIVGAIEGIAEENGFGDYMVISGGALFAAMHNALYASANDNQRSHVMQFGHIPFYTDIRSYRAIAGTKSLFIVEKSVFAAWFRNEYGAAAMVDTVNGSTTTSFSVPLHYYANFENDGGSAIDEFSYMLNGVAQRIRTDIRMQRHCGTANGLGKRKPVAKFEAITTGMIQVRPILNTSHTGIIKVSQQ